MIDQTERYFYDTNFLFKCLRLVNLMEPGRAVISLSKLFFMTMIFIMVWTTIHNPENIVALIASSTGTLFALLNYMKRRTDNIKAGIGLEPIPCLNDEPVIEVEDAPEEKL